MPRFAIAPLGLTTEGSNKFKLKGWKCYLKNYSVLSFPQATLERSNWESSRTILQFLPSFVAGHARAGAGRLTFHRNLVQYTAVMYIGPPARPLGRAIGGRYASGNPILLSDVPERGLSATLCPAAGPPRRSSHRPATTQSIHCRQPQLADFQPDTQT